MKKLIQQKKSAVTNTYHEVGNAAENADRNNPHGNNITQQLGHEVCRHTVKSTHILMPETDTITNHAAHITDNEIHTQHSGVLGYREKEL